MYYRCLKKKWWKCVKEKNGERKVDYAELVSSTFFSAETLMFLVVAFFSSVISGLGLDFMLGIRFRIIISIGFAAVLFIRLLFRYYSYLKNVFMVLVDGTSESFNFAFSKAWLLHFFSFRPILQAVLPPQNYNIFGNNVHGSSSPFWDRI